MVETGEGKPPSTVMVKVAAFKSEFEFFEALNLFIMWTTAGAGVRGLRRLVPRGLRLRQHPRPRLHLAVRGGLLGRGPPAPWRTRRGGSLTFMNAIHQVHLQSLLSEAETTLAHLSPKVVSFFRFPPAAAGRGGGR